MYRRISQGMLMSADRLNWRRKKWSFCGQIVRTASKHAARQKHLAWITMPGTLAINLELQNEAFIIWPTLSNYITSHIMQFYALLMQFGYNLWDHCRALWNLIQCFKSFYLRIQYKSVQLAAKPKDASSISLLVWNVELRHPHRAEDRSNLPANDTKT